jgi:hypothetical protein
MLTPLSLPQTRDALLRYRGRETTVSGHSDLEDPPFPESPTVTTSRQITFGPQPTEILTQKQQQVRARRAHELAKRRGRARGSHDILRVRGIDAAVTVDIAADDFVGAYRDEDWSVVIETLEGEVRFDVAVDAARPLASPPFPHEIAAGGNSTVKPFPQPLIAAT